MLKSFFVTDLTSFLTILICGLIVIISIFSIVFRFHSTIKKRPVGPITSLAPGAVISLGIFGTFLGIYLGLKNFDTSSINDSIPSLLEGLKTAFITSLFGMLSSLLIKYIHGIFDKLDLKRAPSSVDDPILILRKISIDIESLSTNLTSVNDSLLRCFKSDEEFSFVSQLKIIRTDINDLKREIIKSLDQFGEKVAQLGTEAMIEALRNVIEQFNARLNDLVGEEFKQLKEAMIKLVDWQREHKDSMDKMQSYLSQYIEKVEKSVELLDRVSTSVKSTSEHLDSIDGSLSAITISSEKMENHVNLLKNQNAELHSLLNTIKVIGEEAKLVLPNISKHIDSSTKELVESAKISKENLLDAGRILKESTEKIMSDLKILVEEHTKQVDKTTDQIQRHLESVLETSLTSLGGELASLSKKFTEDYTPLTENLRKVVRLSEGLKNE